MCSHKDHLSLCHQLPSLPARQLLSGMATLLLITLAPTIVGASRPNAKIHRNLLELTQGN